MADLAKEAVHCDWALFSVCFNTILAFLLATAVYQIGSRMG